MTKSEPCCPIYSQREKPTCGLKEDCDPHPNPEHWVDAKFCTLHAAAPKLLKALREITDRYERLDRKHSQDPCPNGSVHRARVAIAHADGLEANRD